MRTGHVLSVLVLALCLSAPAAPGDLIVYGTHTCHVLVPGAELEDVRLSVAMSATGGVARVSFTNVSVDSGESAVFKEIVIDTGDDDTGELVLWDPVIQTDTPDVSYEVGATNGLPGYQDETGKGFAVLELQADPAPPQCGIGVGETLVVDFTTLLADGSDEDDYLAFFDGGDDTGSYAIGFHAISADVVDGGSLSGIYMPEPVTLSLLALGGPALIRRRRR